MFKATCRAHPNPQLQPPNAGPGTELTALFAEIDVTEKPDCNCKAIAAEMDRAGVAGCRERREYFLGRLEENAKLYSWREKLAAGRAAWSTGKPLTLAGLFDEAIRRAEAKDAVALLALSGPPVTRDAGWHLRPDVLAAQQALLDRAVAARPQPPEWFAGRGIVTLGGTAKYFGAAWVLVSLLRKLGCTLPVEWWFLGKSEMDARMIDLAQSLGDVQCVDLYERLGAHGRAPRRVAGWEAKVWAVMFSHFGEVLWLDADNVPARDPASLFDDPNYRRAGAVFWPDFPPHGWSVTAAAFEVARLAVPGRTHKPAWHNPTDYRPFETGQFLLDKSRQWPALELCATICDQSDFWFPREHKGKQWHLYGDKDAFYLAWERMGQETGSRLYAMPPAETADVRFAGGRSAGAFMQHDFAGRLLFQHRVQPACKWRLHGDNPAVPGSLHHADCLAALAALREPWSGQVYDAADESPAERAVAATIGGEKVWFHQQQPRRLALLPGGKTTDSELYWTVRQTDQPLLVLATFDRALAFLGRDDKGNWVNHGTQDFLMDAPPAGFDLPLAPSEVVIWHEVVRDNEYRLPERFRHGDVVIDVGGHCGMFAWACLSRGAGRVISVEPHPENFARLENNLRPFGERSQRINAAAWSAAGELHLAQPEGAKHTGGWSAVGVAVGVPAKAIPFDSLITRSTRLVKLDCEGSEWEILRGCRTFDLVDAWCGEWHQRTFAEAAAELRSLLEPHGYAVSVERHPGVERLGHFWAVRRGGC